MIAFMFGFIPFAILMDVNDRERNFPTIDTQWTHCGLTLSRYNADCTVGPFWLFAFNIIMAAIFAC